MDDEQSVERVVSDLGSLVCDGQDALVAVAGFEDVPALDYGANYEQCDGLAGARVGGLEGCHVICVALIEKRCDLECARALWLLRVSNASLPPKRVRAAAIDGKSSGVWSSVSTH